MNVQNTLRQYGEWDIKLKDDNNNKKLDFAPVRRKIFSRIILLMAGAFFGIWFLYQYVLQGRFADGIVRFLYDFTSMTYEDARDFYWHNIGNHFELIFFGAIALVFCLMFYFFLNSFTKYFQEIDDGINALVHHDGRQIRMSKEMAAMEEKLNSVNATLNRQLYDIQMAEKKKDELVLYLAHDIRTPLTSVIGYLKLLEEMPDISKEQQDKFIHVTLDKALRLEVLVNEFFDITRFNRQDIELATTEIDLYYMLMQLSDEVYPLLAPEHKKVEIRADENCKVYGDADKLARIFNNILKMPLPTATRTVPLLFPHGRSHREPLSCSVIRGRPYHRKNSSVFLTNSIGGMKRDRPTAEERVWDLPSQKNWWICMEEPSM